MSALSVSALLLIAVAPAGSQAMPVFPESAPPHLYGRIVLDNFSTKAGMTPVGFDHWLHRAMYTCRLCHVEVGFAMAAGATKISSSTNRASLHCGACHNGTTVHEGKVVFPACVEGQKTAECARCHGEKDPRTIYQRFSFFTGGLPHNSSGMINWEEAEGRGQVKPRDSLDGVSPPRARLKIDKDIALQVKGTWLGNVTFSHKKHARWNGCEVCHPEIFPSTSRGAVRYGMAEIRAGTYCGVCHNKVAFPLVNCRGCHVKDVSE